MRGCQYIGQTSGYRNDPAYLLHLRRGKHCSSARCEQHEVGFLSLLSEYGDDAFEWKVLHHRRGLKGPIAAWADEMETKLIAEHGGPLVDMDVPCKQTLNLTSGGSGTVQPCFEALSRLRWRRFYNHVCQFADSFGHAEIPRKYVLSNGYRLGEHVHNVRQKQLFVDGHAERKVALESIGFVWNTLDNKWSKFLEHMALYKSMHGDYVVPRGYVTEDGFPLGARLRWFRTGQCAQNHPERRTILQAMGIVISVHDDRWTTFLDELQQFHSKYGHCNVARKYTTKDGYKLGVIAGGVRNGGNMVRGRPARRAALQAMGFKLLK